MLSQKSQECFEEEKVIKCEKTLNICGKNIAGQQNRTCKSPSTIVLDVLEKKSVNRDRVVGGEIRYMAMTNCDIVKL